MLSTGDISWDKPKPPRASCRVEEQQVNIMRFGQGLGTNSKQNIILNQQWMLKKPSILGVLHRGKETESLNPMAAHTTPGCLDNAVCARGWVGGGYDNVHTVSGRLAHGHENDFPMGLNDK